MSHKTPERSVLASTRVESYRGAWSATNGLRVRRQTSSALIIPNLGLQQLRGVRALENGLLDYDGGIMTREFLRELANHLESDKEFDIQTGKFTKCRFLALAKRYVVRDGEVLHADLNSPELIDE